MFLSDNNQMLKQRYYYVKLTVLFLVTIPHHVADKVNDSMINKWRMSKIDNAEDKTSNTI